MRGLAAIASMPVRYNTMNLTKKQIDHLVNVHGLRAPRSKERKAQDQALYKQGYKKTGTTLKTIYQIVKETI